MLEIKNFERTCNILAELWSNLKIDGHSVLANYISPKNEEDLKVFVS